MITGNLPCWSKINILVIMNIILSRLCVSLILASIFLSGALTFCFLDMQKASAADVLKPTVENPQNENENGSISQAGISTDEDLFESLSFEQKKLSTDLLYLTDQKYMLQEERSENLRERMLELGQLIEVSGSEPMTEANAGKTHSKNYSETVKKVHVDIYLEPFSKSSALDNFCEVTGRDEENNIVEAWARVDSLEALASLPEVKNVQTIVPPLVRQEHSATERDPSYNSSRVRELYGVNGTGIKIGVISDGVDNLAEAQASEALPSDVHVLSNRIQGREGTAMLEIIHDLAPGAELYFHDCGNTRLEFNTALDALVSQGCTIVCDDIGWLSEPFFEDGIVASHVKKVIKDHDILYVSAAGNSGDKHYQGVFYDNGGGWHDFSEGQREEKHLRLHIQPSGKVWVFLEWADKWEHSGNNYDLFLVDGDNSEFIASSEMKQDGNDHPLEYIMYTNKREKPLNASIQVRKTGGEARELELFIYHWQGVTVSPENIVPEDSIFGHPALPEVITVGAVNSSESGTYKLENFSSMGPATFAYPAQEIRPKPDLSGISGINVTGSGGIPRKLHGTSASAPYAAGIACLVWSAFPEKSGMDIKRLLCSSAIDLGKPGYDTVFGYGLVDTLKAYELAARETNTFTVNKNGSRNFSSFTGAVNSSNSRDSDENGMGDTPYRSDSYSLMERLAFYSRNSALGNTFSGEGHATG
jgi:subtilisin family serine protease